MTKKVVRYSVEDIKLFAEFCSFCQCVCYMYSGGTAYEWAVKLLKDLDRKFNKIFKEGIAIEMEVKDEV